MDKIKITNTAWSPEIAWVEEPESSSILREGKSEFERTTIFFFSGPDLTKVNSIPLVDQIDPWDFVNLSHPDRDMALIHWVISIYLCFLCLLSFCQVPYSTVYLDHADHFSDPVCGPSWSSISTSGFTPYSWSNKVSFNLLNGLPKISENFDRCDRHGHLCLDVWGER
jgi:hypothetical protein